LFAALFLPSPLNKLWHTPVNFPTSQKWGFCNMQDDIGNPGQNGSISHFLPQRQFPVYLKIFNKMLSIIKILIIFHRWMKKAENNATRSPIYAMMFFN
jgi:hypothetical protein